VSELVSSLVRRWWQQIPPTGEHLYWRYCGNNVHLIENWV